MTPAAAISRAARPPKHYVCGVELRPYCIGHWLHMQREEVSFVTGADHSLGDLLLGVLICSETHEGFAESLRAGNVERAMVRWQRRLSGGFLGDRKRRFKQAVFDRCSRSKRFKRFRGRFLVAPQEVIGFDFEKACQEFQFYIDDHGGGNFSVNDWARPITASQSNEPPSPVNAPELMVLLDLLTNRLGLDELDAMNMPLPMARWRWAIHAERNGWVRIVDTDEAQSEQERANAFTARYERGEVVL